MASKNQIYVYSPLITDEDKEAIAATARTGWVSSLSPQVAEFERSIASFIGVKEAVSTMNGTTALHLILAGLGIGRGDEVIVPALTFIAAAASAVYTGARPVFADVSATDWNISPAEIERLVTKRTRAVIVVHSYGNPANVPAIGKILRELPRTRHAGVEIVEDAAEAFGATCGEKKVGSLGRAGAFSFYGNKIITTGEGGMVTTNDVTLAKRLRFLRDHAMDPTRRYYHPEIGWNYRITALQASLGLSQLRRAGSILSAKKRIAEGYALRLEHLRELELHPRAFPHGEGVFWMYSILAENGRFRNRLINHLASAGIDTRPFFEPLPGLPPFRDGLDMRDYPIARDLSARGINLPSGAGLSDSDLDRIARSISRFFKSGRRKRPSTRAKA